MVRFQHRQLVLIFGFERRLGLAQRLCAFVDFRASARKSGLSISAFCLNAARGCLGQRAIERHQGFALQ